MKKIAIGFLFIFALTLLFGCSKKAEFKLDKPILNIEIGTNEQLATKFIPELEKTPTITWSSGDEKIASVDSNGLVKALAIGSTIITAKSQDGKYVATTSVTVRAKTVKAIKLNKDTLSLEVGAIEKLEPLIEPNDAGNKKVLWETSNATIATVDENGTVKAAAVGTADITVKTEDGALTAKCAVIVKEKPKADVPTQTKTTSPTSKQPSTTTTTPSTNSDSITVSTYPGGISFNKKGNSIAAGFTARAFVNPQPRQFVIQVGNVIVPETDFRATITVNGHIYTATGRTNMDFRAFQIDNDDKYATGTFPIDVFVKYSGKEYKFSTTVQSH